MVGEARFGSEVSSSLQVHSIKTLLLFHRAESRDDDKVVSFFGGCFLHCFKGDGGVELDWFGESIHGLDLADLASASISDRWSFWKTLNDGSNSS